MITHTKKLVQIMRFCKRRKDGRNWQKNRKARARIEPVSTLAVERVVLVTLW